MTRFFSKMVSKFKCKYVVYNRCGSQRLRNKSTVVIVQEGFECPVWSYHGDGINDLTKYQCFALAGWEISYEGRERVYRLMYTFLGHIGSGVKSLDMYYGSRVQVRCGMIETLLIIRRQSSDIWYVLVRAEVGGNIKHATCDQYAVSKGDFCGQRSVE